MDRLPIMREELPKWQIWMKRSDRLRIVWIPSETQRLLSEKGFCIGSAAFTALAMIVAYAQAAGLDSISLLEPGVIVGLMIGAMLPYLFTALTIRSVGTAANHMIDEVRRQFKADPGIMAGTSKPDYAQCVDISTKAALHEMIVPGLIAVCSPVIIGLLLGTKGLGGMLLGALLSAIMLAVFMAWTCMNLLISYIVSLIV